MISASNAFEKVLNFNGNLARIFLDFFGQVLPKNLETRIQGIIVKLARFPSPDSNGNTTIAILDEEKGEDNSTLVGVNSNRELVYRIKIEDEEREIIASLGDLNIELNKEFSVVSDFDKGNMTLSINKTHSTTPVSFPDDSKYSSFGYSNFTGLNNGARIGAPVRNFTETNVGDDNNGDNLVALDGEISEFLFF